MAGNVSRDVPAHGVEDPKKDPIDRSDEADCRHDGCYGSTCRYDAIQDAVDKIRARLDAAEKDCGA